MGTNFSDYNSNTSHVIVKQKKRRENRWRALYSNTSHVIVKLCRNCSQLSYSSYSNTSHVIVKRKGVKSFLTILGIQIHPML